MSARTLLLDLAARGARFPIGTDLVLSEQAHPEAIKLDGAALGRVTYVYRPTKAIAIPVRPSDWKQKSAWSWIKSKIWMTTGFSTVFSP